MCLICTYVTCHQMRLRSVCTCFTEGATLFVQNLAKYEKGKHYTFWLVELKQTHLGVVPTQVAEVALDLPGPLPSKGLTILVWRTLCSFIKENSLFELKHDPGLCRGISYLSSVKVNEALILSRFWKISHNSYSYWSRQSAKIPFNIACFLIKGRWFPVFFF